MGQFIIGIDYFLKGFGWLPSSIPAFEVTPLGTYMYVYQSPENHSFTYLAPGNAFAFSFTAVSDPKDTEGFLIFLEKMMEGPRSKKDENDALRLYEKELRHRLKLTSHILENNHLCLRIINMR